MPRRTNDFQDLVALLQRCLADEGAVVTESAMVLNRSSEDREIDVLIETTAGPYRIRVAVEAKDEGRPMDSTRFESIVGKYFSDGGIKVNKVVVVTHRGFYKPVIERARLLDVDLFTLTEAKQLDWSQFRPPGPCLRSKVSIENIRILPETSLSKHQIEHGKVICSCGRNYGSLSQFARYLFWANAVRQNNELLTTLDNQVATSSATKTAKVNLTLPHNHTAELIGQESKLPIDGLSFEIVLSKQEVQSPNLLPNIQFRLAPHICRIETDPPLQVPITKDFQKSAHLVCQCCGKDHGSLLEWSHDLMFRRLLPNQPEWIKQFEERLRSEASGQALMTLHFPLNQRWRIKHAEQVYKASKLLISVHAGMGSGKLECKQFDWTSSDGKSRRISHMEATVAGKRFQFMIPDGLASKKIALRIDDAAGKKADTKRRNAILRAAKRKKRDKE